MVCVDLSHLPTPACALHVIWEVCLHGRPLFFYLLLLPVSLLTLQAFNPAFLRRSLVVAGGWDPAFFLLYNQSVFLLSAKQFPMDCSPICHSSGLQHLWTCQELCFIGWSTCTLTPCICLCVFTTQVKPCRVCSPFSTLTSLVLKA
jgi:hypothetical protein